MRKPSLILHISATRLPHGILSARHAACDHCRLPNKTFHAPCATPDTLCLVFVYNIPSARHKPVSHMILVPTVDQMTWVNIYPGNPHNSPRSSWKDIIQPLMHHKQKVEEMSTNSVIKKIYDGEIPGRRPRGRLRKRWSCNFD